MRTMQESLIRHEKEILNKVYDHLEWKDDKDGLTKEEFDEFLAALPQSYRERFDEYGQKFEQMAGDDGILDYNEFTQLVDKFAEAEAKAGGSQDQ